MSEECFRTGIYVYAPTTVTIETAEAGLKLAQLNGPLDLATLGTSTNVALQPGIYRVLSKQAVTVTGDNIKIQTAAGKIPWPTPDPDVLSFFGGAVTEAAVDEFFVEARAISL